MRKNTLLKQFMLCIGLAAGSVMAQTPYDDGQRYLREQRWIEAADQFKVAITGDKDNAEAAMYWRAHALYKAGRNKEAGRQVRHLVRRSPESHWVNEARALQIEYEEQAEATGSSLDESGFDDELRMFALMQLMEQNPERAMPLVQAMFRESDSESVRGHALFVLGMSADPAASQLIAEVARDNSNPHLQVEAIRMLGLASTDQAGALLQSLYREATNDEVREAVIHAYIGSDNPKPLLGLMQTEQKPALQREIIHALGAMGATVELGDIYTRLEDRETKIVAIQAFSIGGDSNILRHLLDSETDPQLRKAAIVGIAVDGDEGAVETLGALYGSAQSVEEKSGILEALVIMDEASELAMKIIREESDQQLKRQAIEALGMMDATEELGALYQSIDDVETRQTVLNALAIADDTGALAEILKSEQNPRLRAQAIESLSISGGSKVTEYLVSLYPDGTQQEKVAIIRSMMISDDAPGLIGLLRQESNRELKREMLQVLVAMDTEESQTYLFELLESRQ